MLLCFCTVLTIKIINLASLKVATLCEIILFRLSFFPWVIALNSFVLFIIGGVGFFLIFPFSSSFLGNIVCKQRR